MRYGRRSIPDARAWRERASQLTSTGVLLAHTRKSEWPLQKPLRNEIPSVARLAGLHRALEPLAHDESPQVRRARPFQRKTGWPELRRVEPGRAETGEFSSLGLIIRSLEDCSGGTLILQLSA